MKISAGSLALALIVTATAMLEPLTTAVAFAQSGGTIVNSQSNRPKPQPGVRPQRYYCAVDPPASAKMSGQFTCPAEPGRVGGRCRCANVTGSGTLYTY